MLVYVGVKIGVFKFVYFYEIMWIVCFGYNLENLVCLVFELGFLFGSFYEFYFCMYGVD